MGLIFAGFLFKGTMKDFAAGATADDKAALLKRASAALAALGDDIVCCTSGDGTGVPLAPERAAMYRAAVAGPIAVASGVTVDNVASILPFVDVFMVATGIEVLSGNAELQAFYAEAKMPPAVDLGHLDAALVQAMGAKIHDYGDAGK